MRDVLPTRSAAIELADERRLMRQGYSFLDEKRMLLAGEMLRRMRDYELAQAEFIAAARTAADALARAVERHGLDGVQVHPCGEGIAVGAPGRNLFLGLAMLQAQALSFEGRGAPAAVDPSPEAQACRLAFEQLVVLANDLGVRAGNLLRLVREYRRTERRAMTLEKVLLPEVEQALARVDEQLDTMDREEAIRTRWSRRGR